MPVVIEGIKEVLGGLNNIDEDMRRRIVFITAPMMRRVAAKAQGYVPGNQDLTLVSSPSTMRRLLELELVITQAKIRRLLMAGR